MIWAGIEREMVNYINAHATSTPVGDISEIKAMRQVFSDSPNLTVNGTKSMVLPSVACRSLIRRSVSVAGAFARSGGWD